MTIQEIYGVTYNLGETLAFKNEESWLIGDILAIRGLYIYIQVNNSTYKVHVENVRKSIIN